MSGQNADYKEILLDGKHYVLSQPISEANLNTWQGKTVIGDYSKDDNELLSSWIINDNTGGNGVQRLITATDSGRYNISGLYTRFPYQITLPYLWDKSAPISVNNAYYPLGGLDLNNDGTFEAYAVSGTTLMANDVSLGLTALTAAPVSKGCEVFIGTNVQANLFIPMGTSGYATYNQVTATVTNVAPDATHPKALWFEAWDDKLICLDTAGQLWKNTGTSAATWTNYGARAKLPKGEAHFPRGLVVFQNGQGDPTIHVVTRLGLWAFDAGGPKLWRVKIKFPQHARMAESFCEWRGDLYITAGMDVIQWNGSVQRNIGLSRDNGLPIVDADGYILDLDPSINSLTAVVFDTHTGSTVDYSVHEWSGLGWHMLWHDAGTGETPTWAMTTRDNASIFDFLYVGLAKNGRLRQSRPISYANPRNLKTSSLQQFGYNGTPVVTNPWTYLSGRFDAGMAGYKKLASSVEIFVDTYPLSWQIFVDYRIDGASAFTQLGSQLPNVGLNTLLFGTLTSDQIYTGLAFHDIELRLRYVPLSYDGTTPIVEYLNFTYMKLKKSSFSWVVNIDLNAPQNDRSPEQIRTDILALHDTDRFFSAQIGPYTKRVRLSQSDGNKQVSDDERGNLRVNVLEIPHSFQPNQGPLQFVATGS